ncbi:TetR family transcriptional regulator [Sporolactobacillus kofuensis]|uniref:TetR family transcriptional regulator n=1 Tax=Sporolactobacillus kofuensis TaxID=269672 RepID=A0ABW1WB88_9BACL|nr:TetR family transcriptional regulator [Sporolactobacillus kofuensis]MCO7174564.1 TetR family transcriptional regulator [Sporolactobacillus kofuensis]
MPKVTEAHVAERRKQILAAAQDVFSTKGFEPATMQDIVKISGMSRGGVYQYFGSTEAMMRALLEQNTKEFSDYVQSLIQKNGIIWDSLVEYLNSVSKEANTPFSIAVYEYFVSGWHNEERKAYLAKRYLNGQSVFLQLFKEGVRRGEFFPCQPLEVITRFFINVTDGIALEASLLNHQLIDTSNQIDSLKLYLKTALGIDKMNVE